MAKYSLNRLVRGYMAPQTSHTAAATVTGSNYFLCNKLSLETVTQMIRREDITGSLTDLPGIIGRRSGTWSIDADLTGSGAAGTPPSLDPLYASLFGQTATVNAGTSVAYSLCDDAKSFTLYKYVRSSDGTPTTAQIGFGAVPRTVSFSLGQDLAKVSASGDCLFVIENDVWGNLDTSMKGGLASFPAEPSTPSQSSVAIVGFTGSITLDSQTQVSLKSAGVTINTGKAMVYSFGGYIPNDWESDMRSISMSLTLDDDNGTALADLKSKSFLGSTIECDLQIGTIAGSTCLLTLKGVQLSQFKYLEGSRRLQVSFDGSIAHGTNPAASSNDALAMLWT